MKATGAGNCAAWSDFKYQRVSELNRGTQTARMPWMLEFYQLISNANSEYSFLFNISVECRATNRRRRNLLQASRLLLDHGHIN